jgi:hypothetical protein
MLVSTGSIQSGSWAISHREYAISSLIASPQDLQTDWARASGLTELTPEIGDYLGDSVGIALWAGGFDILRGFVTPVAQ